jgi:hypothetical protein
MEAMETETALDASPQRYLTMPTCRLCGCLIEDGQNAGSERRPLHLSCQQAETDDTWLEWWQRTEAAAA